MVGTLAPMEANSSVQSVKSVNHYLLDPLLDPRWDELVSRHPNASVFHERGWLEALSRTYGYAPMVLTSTVPGERLKDGMVFCRVASWITGTRLVSLPFADHCEPLLSGTGETVDFMNWLRAECERQRCKYFEIRPRSALQSGSEALQPDNQYCIHQLDLSLPETQLFERLHKSSVQRKIRRAEREHLSYEVGRSKRLQDEFYRLLLLTRRRHRLPPQPRAWFGNVVECMGEKAVIRVARKNGAAIAAMLTLRHGPCIVFKYGCSDARFHNLGGVSLLFWRLIQESKAAGIETIDFGRSDLENPGLVAFKNKWGTKRTTLTYYRCAGSRQSLDPWVWNSRAARQFLSLLPDVLFSAAGRLLYRHIG